MAEHKLAKASDIAEGNCQAFTVDGQAIAVFNVGGKFSAIEDTCKHRGGSLGGGTLDGEIVTCPLHGWTYNVTTGECTANPQVQMKCFPVKVEGEEIVVEV